MPVDGRFPADGNEAGRIADLFLQVTEDTEDTETPRHQMKRRGYISPRIETLENFEAAFRGFVKNKEHRGNSRRFAANLEANLMDLVAEYRAGTGRTSEYRDEEISEPKRRTISKLPVRDHVRLWAPLIQTERLFTDTYIRRSCSCVKGRGTHDFIDLLRGELYADPEGTRYFVQLDAHHYFKSIAHFLMKERIRRKIKDPKLLRFLDEFIDSYPRGLPLGVKISQILANFFLAGFDHAAVGLFGISGDPDKLAYWRNRYVTDSLLTCRTAAEAADLGKGVAYMAAKFDRYAREPVNYFRFADNIVMLHGDKVFLHLVTGMCIMVLARDYLIEVNRNWNVRPVWSGGIDVCGYVSYHTHRALRKRNKKALCRQVARCRKKGLTPEETRLRCASRIGFAIHANTNNLLRKLDINMEKRLGKVIKDRRANIPFKGMRHDQKRPFTGIVCKDPAMEDDFKIMLLDYAIEDSKVETEDYLAEVTGSDGAVRQERRTRPKKCLVIRYKRILQTTVETTVDGEERETYTYEKEKDRDGNPTARDAEYYSYTGSTVMIDQADNDFSKDDLPCPTVVMEQVNKMNKKFYKFT